MRNHSLAMKTSSAYARLPLAARTLPDIIALDRIAHNWPAPDLRPRLVRRQEPLGLPSSPEALLAQSLDPARVAAWLRA